MAAPRAWTPGFYVEPTVFAQVDMSMRIAREEIFGPVMSVLTWRDYEDMLEQVNSLDVGLTGNIWTNDISLALRTARRIHSGYISINGTGKRPIGSPFGGLQAERHRQGERARRAAELRPEEVRDRHPLTPSRAEITTRTLLLVAQAIAFR